MDYSSYFTLYENWPKPGVSFRDISPLLEDTKAMYECCSEMAMVAKKHKFTKVVAIDSRGFLFGSLIALISATPLVMARKAGKLPGEVVTQEYEYEYGTATIQIQKASINPEDKVLIVDDVLATGRSAGAACKLVESLGAKVVCCTFALEIAHIDGRGRLDCPVVAPTRL